MRKSNDFQPGTAGYSARLALALALAASGAAGAAEAPASVVGSARATDPAPDAEARFQDWRLTCTESDCAIHTAVQGAGQDAREVLRLGVVPAPDLPAGRALVIETALALLVADPAALTVGPGAERAIPWRICGPEGCMARAELTPDLLGELRRARSALVAFTLADGVRVRLQPSLMGFSAAEGALAGR